MGHVAFNQASVSGRELQYLQRALADGHWTGDGPFARSCTELLERESGASRVLLTPSCTHGLELAALLLDIRKGDEVILPSFTFASTANAFVLRGARPVFVDIRPDTLNLDEAVLDELITPRTRAIVPVHYAGVSCEMDAIGAIGQRCGIAVVEDNAQGLFGAYHGKPLGAFGVLSAVSFHGTKNITCGEGGALFINDVLLVERAEIIREKGTDRARFLRGEVDKYTWRSVGSSYLLSDILAAFLLAQLEEWKAIYSNRKRIWDTYYTRLQAWAEAGGIVLPTVPRHCAQTFHLFYMLMPSAELRSALLDELHRSGIQATTHYEPLHLAPMGKTFGYREGELPVTESVAKRLVRLPLHTALRDEDLDYICSAVTAFPRKGR